MGTGPPHWHLLLRHLDQLAEPTRVAADTPAPLPASMRRPDDAEVRPSHASPSHGALRIFSRGVPRPATGPRPSSEAPTDAVGE